MDRRLNLRIGRKHVDVFLALRIPHPEGIERQSRKLTAKHDSLCALRGIKDDRQRVVAVEDDVSSCMQKRKFEENRRTVFHQRSPWR